MERSKRIRKPNPKYKQSEDPPGHSKQNQQQQKQQHPSRDLFQKSSTPEPSDDEIPDLENNDEINITNSLSYPIGPPNKSWTMPQIKLFLDEKKKKKTGKKKQFYKLLKLFTQECMNQNTT